MRAFKAVIAKELKLDVNEFRLRKGTRGKELKDQGISDGSCVFAEFGTPAQPDEVSLNFKLYDPTKKLTDPGREKKSFCELMQHPFKKSLKIGQLKVEMINVELQVPDRGWQGQHLRHRVC